VGTKDGLGQAIQAFERFCSGRGLDQDTTWKFQVSLDEVLSNSIRHGYDTRPDGLIDLTFDLSNGTLTLTVEDDGPAFDPLSLPEPDVAAPLESRRPGGLGVHFVKRLMDGVEYERRGGLNRLVFWRRVAAAAHNGELTRSG
jgi:serine/threonine-protein kinase RsbW